MSDCICDIKVEKKCPVCARTHLAEKAYAEKLATCPAHKRLVCCGIPYYFCPECEEQGWSSHFGTGGSADIFNTKTGEVI